MPRLHFHRYGPALRRHDDPGGSSPADTVITLFRARGARRYTLDRITHLDHALQAATLAAQGSATDVVVCAALLHDVGHLLSSACEDIADLARNDNDEQAGADWLARFFDPEVTDLVRGHVQAKRYLCATEPWYVDKLSIAALRLLEVQGGPMNDLEVERFEASGDIDTLVWLRRIDDAAKTPGMCVPDIEAFRGCIEAALPLCAQAS